MFFSFSDEDGAATDWQVFEIVTDETDQMDAKYEERTAFINDALAAGWKWSETEPNILRDPQNQTRYMWVDPHTNKALLSLALLEESRHRVRGKNATGGSKPKKGFQWRGELIQFGRGLP